MAKDCKLTKKNLVFVLMLILILLLIGCLFLKDKEINKLENTISNSTTNKVQNVNKGDNQNENNQQENKDEDEQNYVRLSITNGEYKTIINNIIPVTDNITLNETEIVIKNNNILIGNSTRKIENETITKVTGFYEQSGDAMCIYALTESKKVYVLGYVGYLGIKEKQFKKTDINDVDNLILLDVEVHHELIGQTPERNQIYALIGENLFNIRKKCIEYDNE